MSLVEVKDTLGESLRCCEIRGDGASRLVYRADPPPGLPKAGFHPIVTPAGAVISGWEPSDHIWHRGLWFTFKFVNGDNFWEEHPPFGIQRTIDSPEGLTATPLPGGAAILRHQLQWESPAHGVVLSESRRWRYEPLHRGNRSSGGMVIDFATTLTAVRDLTLDRTPYTNWGGYGGLSFRASREMHGVELVTPEGQVDATPGLTGQRHAYLVMRGRMDGGADRWVSMLVVDHPANVRYPTPWYAKSSNGFTFWNAALLFHEPLRLPRGDRLALRYRVCVVDGRWDAPLEWAELTRRFASES